ncbi:MAG: beta-glucosidase [Promethearchaeota archaeon]
MGIIKIFDKSMDEFVETTLKKMTLDEKIYAMSGHHFFKHLFTDMKFGKRAYSGGGVKRFNIPPFLFTDGPRGVRIPGSTCFPVSMARGATWDLGLEEQVGEVIGKEVRAHGGTLFGGVCVNLLRHPAWGRAQETYGEDPFHVGQFGVAMIKGVQKHNVMATVKHFAANSIENARFKVNVKMDERTLREVYLPHFKKCIEKGCATVMTAYNKLRGEYCSHNEYLVRDILKKEWDFTGFVHSDWMDGIHDTVKGIKAGLDVEMPRAKHYGKRLKKKVLNGDVSIDLVNDSVTRIISTVLKFTSAKDPQNYNFNLVGCNDHIQVTRKVANKSMVLLKNDSKLLPFDSNEIKTISIFGSLANLKNTGDHGSSNVPQQNIVTHLQGIKNLYGNEVKIMFNEGKNLEKAKVLAQSVDAVIVIAGYTYKDEGEYIRQKINSASDRTNLGLKNKDIKLIKAIASANSSCVVGLVGGSAIIMEDWKDYVPAIIMTWYSGMEGGNAFADIIFGRVNPSGKLPISIPKHQDHLPFFDKDADEIEYGYYHGYSLLEMQDIEPAFPFGFGLSYTDYQYENLRVEVLNEKIIATVEVTNIGDLVGEEIVQLYVGYENSKIDRPKKSLKGFRRVQIIPKETKSIKIEIDKGDLSFYNPKTNQWELEKMIYKIMVGPSSDNKKLLSTIINL